MDIREAIANGRSQEEIVEMFYKELGEAQNEAKENKHAAELDLMEKRDDLVDAVLAYTASYSAYHGLTQSDENVFSDEARGIIYDGLSKWENKEVHTIDMMKAFEDLINDLLGK